ncbi:MAG: stage II sporulation protein D [Oscillospiraceae bacterium]|nr:stage II sporulation protein D [Oscillospiraceae bacterium]
MRWIIPISLVILLLALLLPLIFVYSPALPMPGEADEPEEPEEISPPPDAGEPESPLQDAALILRVLAGDEVWEMSMAEFLQGVVAAEMPARFHPEALRAQAVAARTYALHRMLVAPSPRHPEAHVCGSYACCKAFHPPERLRERWGDGFEHYSAVIAEAIRDTDGIILLYEARPILAAFHAGSYGYTEASGAIWGEVPYLQSVRSFESEADMPRFYAAETLTFTAFRDTVRREFSDAVLEDGNTLDWITSIVYTDSGRVAHLDIGGVTVTGPQFRRLFGLRSTAVRFSFDADGITITTGGHGHGVGMSQFGANTMANLGHGFMEILDWYYTGVTFGRTEDLALDLR